MLSHTNSLRFQQKHIKKFTDFYLQNSPVELTSNSGQFLTFWPSYEFYIIEGKHDNILITFLNSLPKVGPRYKVWYL